VVLGVDRAEDMGFSAEFLKEAGLRLDRRTEFPGKATNVSLTPEREVPAFVLGPMRRAWPNPSKCLEARPLAADLKSLILNRFSAPTLLPDRFQSPVCLPPLARLRDQQGQPRKGKASRHVVNYVYLAQV